MRVIEFPQLDEPRLDDFVRMTDVALRKKLETDRGLFLAEGLKVIARSLEVGYRPRAVLCSEKWFAQISSLIATSGWDESDVEIFICTEDQVKEITGYRIHRGAIASFERPELLDIDVFLDGLAPASNSGRQCIFVLEDLVDHTNVGAIFRSAAALGVSGVLVTPHCADPLYRRSVKVSMGNVFHIPWTRITPWPRGLDLLHERGWVTASLALKPDALGLREFASLEEVRAPDAKVALILGTEGDGLGSGTVAHSKYSVVIPMREGVDSLNVAAAGALAAWEIVGS